MIVYFMSIHSGTQYLQHYRRREHPHVVQHKQVSEIMESRREQWQYYNPEEKFPSTARATQTKENFVAK